MMPSWRITAALAPQALRTRRQFRFASILESGAAQTLLVVDHNPGLQDPALQLVGSGEVGMRAALNERLPTSGLVVIDLAFDDWSRLYDHSGRLERFVSPRLIAAATD